MNYPYRCLKCEGTFEVIKSLAHINDVERCPECQSYRVERYISRTSFYGASVEDAEYNPAFGQVVRDKKHRNQLAKERNMVEIGNETPEKIHKKFDQDRDIKEKTSYDKIVDTSITLTSS